METQGHARDVTQHAAQLLTKCRQQHAGDALKQASAAASGIVPQAFTDQVAFHRL